MIHLSIEMRVLLTIVIVLAVLFALALFGYLTGGWEENPEPLSMRLASAESRPELCMDDETRERVRGIMVQSLDDSLHDKIKELMSIWLRDDTGQPERAQKGMNNALRAYFAARGQAMKFNPPECPAG